MNMWLTDAADGGCGSGMNVAPMHAIRSVGQCDVTFQAYCLAGAARRPLLITTVEPLLYDHPQNHIGVVV